MRLTSVETPNAFNDKNQTSKIKYANRGNLVSRGVPARPEILNRTGKRFNDVVAEYNSLPLGEELE